MLMGEKDEFTLVNLLKKWVSKYEIYIYRLEIRSVEVRVDVKHLIRNFNGGYDS